MGYYRVRLSTEDHEFEADYAYGDDLAAVAAAEDLTVDFQTVEVWRGEHRVAFVTRAPTPSLLRNTAGASMPAFSDR